MAISFEDELRGFLQHRYEQMPEVQRFLVQGQPGTDWSEALPPMTRMIGTHNEALLLIAQQIDQLRVAIGGS